MLHGPFGAQADGDGANKETMDIRAATADEAGAVLELWRDADAEPTHTDDVDSIRLLMDHDPSALIVAVEGGRIIGSVIAGWDGWRGSIYRLAVAPDHRRSGLGRRLLDAAEARIAALGGVRLQAIVVETDSRATAFWRASGWQQQTERLRFVKG
jgi:ribosomal protein S18 acetylase RimI-like enzyme